MIIKRGVERLCQWSPQVNSFIEGKFLTEVKYIYIYKLQNIDKIIIYFKHHLANSFIETANLILLQL